MNILASFHSVTCFPPDVLHDVFEGIIPEDLLGVIRILSMKGWFSLTQYNDSLNRLGYPSYESYDKPCPVPTSSSVKKLKGESDIKPFKLLFRFTITLFSLVHSNP